MKFNILFLTQDDKMVLDFIGYSLEESLKDATIGILETDKEEEAISILEFNTIDLIIADMNIDTLESYEFYDKLQLDVKFQDIPFVFLSSNEEDQEISILKGLSNFFLKPLDVDQLLETLHSILSHSRSTRANINYSIDYDEENFDAESDYLNDILNLSKKIKDIVDDETQKDEVKKLLNQIEEKANNALSTSSIDTYSF